jgi:hypothetical protein
VFEFLAINGSNVDCYPKAGKDIKGTKLFRMMGKISKETRYSDEKRLFLKCFLKDM